MTGEEREELAAIAERHRTLEDVIRWTIARGADLHGIVTQDEYTHDVIVPWRGRWLVYDTT